MGKQTYDTGPLNSFLSLSARPQGAHVTSHRATQICTRNKNLLVHLSRRDGKTLAARRRMAESEMETYRCFLFSLLSLSLSLSLYVCLSLAVSQMGADQSDERW